MSSFKIIEGDLFELAFNGDFDVIGQGCNCFNTQVSGIAVLFKNTFQTDKYPMEFKNKGDINKLGQIEYRLFSKISNQFLPFFNFEETEFNINVVNMYTQYNYGKNHTDGNVLPIDYEALTLCLRKVNKIFSGKRIGLPLIGGGLGGGDKNIIIDIMKKELKDCNTTLVLYKK